MIEVVFPEAYVKKATLFLSKHPELKSQYRKVISLLSLNPFHPSLRLHKLKGRLHGLHSISINLRYRITLTLLFKKDQIVLVDLGSHDEVY